MRWKSVEFITISEAEQIHEEMLRLYGGAGGFFKHHSLEASIMAVQATWAGVPLLDTMADIAAGYAYYITTSHPFIDGNKRTALTTALVFLEKNGYPGADFESMEETMVQVARGESSREDLAEIFADQMGEWGLLE